MMPKFVLLDGPLKGAVFPLSKPRFHIGQLDSNDLVVPDPLVSRRHCLIVETPQGFEIQDLGSRNGTFVNDLPIRERLLQHGDRVSLGVSVLVFLAGEDESPRSPVEVENEDPIERKSMQLRHDEVERLRNSGGQDLASREARELETILRISQLTGTVRSLSELKIQLLELVLEVVPAERAVLLLLSAGSEDFTTVYGRSGAVLEGPATVSRTIVDRVLRDRSALLSSHVLQSEFKRSRSLYLSGVESVLCVPLEVRDRMLGVFYLETTRSNSFDEGHLGLLAAVSGISALAIENCAQIEWLAGEAARLREDLGQKHQIVGESPGMQEVNRLISRVAASDSAVLITGESGTGKELAARAIHRSSDRSEFPFVAINCAAISEALMESELFGHEKGAFTGAINQKKGKIEVADRGTLFLDEIGELAMALQSKLLRVLQEREFERVGGLRPIKVDIRLVAASNRDLDRAREEGSFREDLFYRLNVVPVVLPPLRQRPGDVSLLARFFVSRLNGRGGRRILGISQEAMALLEAYDWPGNVRELQNVIERAVVLGSSDLIVPADLPENLRREDAADLPGKGFHQAVRLQKRRIIMDAIAGSDGNVTEAARRLDLQPTYLHRLIRNLGIREKVKKKRGP